MSLSFPRFAATAAATLVALCAVGAWPTFRVAGGDGLASMGFAAGIAFLGALLGILPSAFSSPRPESRIQAAMLGVGVRLLVTLGATFAVLATEAAPARSPFLLWTGLAYAALLVVETAVLVRSLPRSGGPVSA